MWALGSTCEKHFQVLGVTRGFHLLMLDQIHSSISYIFKYSLLVLQGQQMNLSLGEQRGSDIMISTMSHA